MVSRCLSSRATIWLCLVGAIQGAGCSDAVRLTQETDNGGVVTYLYNEDRGGPMGSPHRKAAVDVIDKKCPAGFTVIRDGEVKGYSSVPSIEGQETSSRRWGIQFRCK